MKKNKVRIFSSEEKTKVVLELRSCLHFAGVGIKRLYVQ